MTLQDAVALQPPWLTWWLTWLTFGAFILPLALLIWRETRIAGLASIVAGVLAAVATSWLYDRFGYVKLLGLPHIVVWTPLVVYMVGVLRKPALPRYARWVLLVVVGTILISLAFDYTDLLRYALGNRAPLAVDPA